MSARTLDLESIAVESFFPTADQPQEVLLDASRLETCYASCGFSCFACQTDEGECSGRCFVPTYEWQGC